ncbi:hypothetical protein [Luedemannella helvata]|uniref:Uncharacterized protein n=1 Tax=Luedemannella helvata TaxID=349315 RepID=A0ABN2L7V3_9ACTN
MVYSEQPGRPVHLSLPLPDMQALANSMKEPPSAELHAAIIAAATASAEQSHAGLVDPYRLHAKVQLSYPSVSIGQIASVLLAWRRVSR